MNFIFKSLFESNRTESLFDSIRLNRVSNRKTEFDARFDLIWFDSIIIFIFWHFHPLPTSFFGIHRLTRHLHPTPPTFLTRLSILLVTQRAFDHKQLSDRSEYYRNYCSDQAQLKIDLPKQSTSESTSDRLLRITPAFSFPPSFSVVFKLTRTFTS